MDIKEYKGVWVYIETEKDKPMSVGLELISAAKTIADFNKEDITAVVIGKDSAPAAEALKEYPVKDIIAVEDESLLGYNTGKYTYALEKLVEKYKPSAFLIGATNNGRDLAPRLACRIRTGLTADCTQIGVQEETGNVAWTRPAFGGNLMATILCPDHRPQLGTVRPGVFKKEPLENAEEHPVIKEKFILGDDSIKAKVIKILEDVDSESVNLQDAEIIVSGGRGVGGPEGFDVIRDAAEAFGGVVGASRAAVDSGWISHIHQVGQTGKTVQPKLYVACGISGAIQHLAGMSSSDCIIAINKDEEAPIFNVCDYGIVGDLFEVLPVLAREVRKYKSAE